MADGDSIAAARDLKPHPEGGFYKRVFTHPSTTATERGERQKFTSILFLLPAGQVSHLHVLQSDEMWVYNGGDTLEVIEVVEGNEGEGKKVKVTKVGPKIENGEVLQYVVPAGTPFGARPTGEYSLVSCIVVPGFDFVDFELTSRAEGLKMVEGMKEEEKEIVVSILRE